MSVKGNQGFIQNKIEIVEDRADLVWAMDKNYRLTAFNTSFKTHLKKNGLGDAERGMDLIQVYQSDCFFNPCEQGCERALKRYATTSKHTFVKDANTVVHEFSFQPFMNSTGEVVGCCVWQKEITQAVDNNHRLLESERKYREAQAVADVGHWNWDMIKNEITWSDQLYKIFDQDSETFKPHYEVLVNKIHPEDRDFLKKDVTKSVEEKIAHDVVFRIIVEDGQVKYVHQKGRAFYDENGKPYRMSGTTQDVTKDVLINQQIVGQNHELQNFVRIISHNLRGPISNLLMLSRIYEWGKDEMNDDIVKKIEHTTEALDQTIKDLHLSLSFKAADKKKFRKVFLKKVVKDVDGLLSEEITKHKATLNIDLSEADVVFGAKSYVVNIFYNLILNAINYAKEGVPAEIKVSAKKTKENIILKFSDNGIGMELTPEKERKIFDMYGRLSGATQGKGFGLYLVKTQVEAMDGKIEVESKIGEGTIFTITFPKAP